MTVQKVWRIALGSFVVVMLARAIVGGDGEQAEDAAPPVPDPAQSIVLQVDGGGEVPFAIQSLNVFLVEDDQHPESFVFEGDGIRLVGKFPPGLHVGYDENWNALVGKPITFSRHDDAAESVSEIHLPGEAACPVTDGAFTIQHVGESLDGKTPLSGALWLRCGTPAGEQMLRGTFEVKGTTWG